MADKTQGVSGGHGLLLERIPTLASGSKEYVCAPVAVPFRLPVHKRNSTFTESIINSSGNFVDTSLAAATRSKARKEQRKVVQFDSMNRLIDEFDEEVSYIRKMKDDIAQLQILLALRAVEVFSACIIQRAFRSSFARWQLRGLKSSRLLLGWMRFRRYFKRRVASVRVISDLYQRFRAYRAFKAHMWRVRAVRKIQNSIRARLVRNSTRLALVRCKVVKTAIERTMLFGRLRARNALTGVVLCPEKTGLEKFLMVFYRRRRLRQLRGQYAKLVFYILGNLNEDGSDIHAESSGISTGATTTTTGRAGAVGGTVSGNGDGNFIINHLRRLTGQSPVKQNLSLRDAYASSSNRSNSINNGNSGFSGVSGQQIGLSGSQGVSGLQEGGSAGRSGSSRDEGSTNDKAEGEGEDVFDSRTSSASTIPTRSAGSHGGVRSSSSALKYTMANMPSVFIGKYAPRDFADAVQLYLDLRRTALNKPSLVDGQVPTLPLDRNKGMKSSSSKRMSRARLHDGGNFPLRALGLHGNSALSGTGGLTNHASSQRYLPTAKEVLASGPLSARGVPKSRPFSPHSTSPRSRLHNPHPPKGNNPAAAATAAPAGRIIRSPRHKDLEKDIKEKNRGKELLLVDISHQRRPFAADGSQGLGSEFNGPTLSGDVFYTTTTATTAAAGGGGGGDVETEDEVGESVSPRTRAQRALSEDVVTAGTLRAGSSLLLANCEVASSERRRASDGARPVNSSFTSSSTGGGGAGGGERRSKKGGIGVSSRRSGSFTPQQQALSQGSPSMTVEDTAGGGSSNSRRHTHSNSHSHSLTLMHTAIINTNTSTSNFSHISDTGDGDRDGDRDGDGDGDGAGLESGFTTNERSGSVTATMLGHTLEDDDASVSSNNKNRDNNDTSSSKHNKNNNNRHNNNRNNNSSSASARPTSTLTPTDKVKQQQHQKQQLSLLQHQGQSYRQQHQEQQLSTTSEDRYSDDYEPEDSEAEDKVMQLRPVEVASSSNNNNKNNNRLGSRMY